MADAYAAADLVVSRAGSNTVFELLALKSPPSSFPSRAERAEVRRKTPYFQKRGLCRVLRQSELGFLPEAVEDAFADEALLSALAVSDFSAETPISCTKSAAFWYKP